MKWDKIQYDKVHVEILNDPHGDPYSHRFRVGAAVKEPGTIYWIENYIKDGDTVWDIGANVGPYSLIIAKMYPNCWVLAFEPVYSNFVLLTANRYHNQAMNIIPLLMAVGDKSGIANFGLYSYAGSVASHPGLQVQGEVEYKVPVFRMDDLLGLSFPYPNHIKIDVDGPELQVLRSLPLAHPALKSIIVEVNDASRRQIEMHMDSWGWVSRPSPESLYAHVGTYQRLKDRLIIPGHNTNLIFERGKK